MVDVIAFGKDELADVGLQFIAVPVLSIPFIDKTFYIKTLWFSTQDELKEKLGSYNPLIIFDQTGKYKDNSIRGFKEKLPNDWRYPTAIFVRAVQGLDSTMWGSILNNVLEPEQMNFTFEWDFSHYTHPSIEKYQQKLQKTKISQKTYDQREREEYELARSSKKISFRK